MRHSAESRAKALASIVAFPARDNPPNTQSTDPQYETTPPRLQSLLEEGLIDSVVRQLMSGKEAMVFVVRYGDDTRCAKIYKEATQRGFRQAVGVRVPQP